LSNLLSGGIFGASPAEVEMRNIGPAHLALLAAAMAAAAFLGSPAPALGASFTVNAAHDAVDASPGDGVCAGAGGACTLRAAVMETNALARADEISLEPGTYVLSIPGLDEDSSASGDLDVTDELVIAAPVIVDGAPEPTAIIDGAALDRVFDAQSGAKLTLFGTIVQGGAAKDSLGLGGGVRNAGELTVQESVVRANSATVSGGGVANLGTGTFSRITIRGNNATANGGGIYNAPSGNATIGLSTVSANSAGAFGGGVANDGFVDIGQSGSGVLTIKQTIISANSGLSGGGINNAGTITVSATTISGNSGVGIGNAGNDTIPGVRGMADIVDSTISGNSGDGIGGGATVTNVTVALNSGHGLSGGFARDMGGKNTLVAYNSAGDCEPNFTIRGGNNLDSDGTCGLSDAGDVSRGYAGLGLLADNGGPTQTHEIHRLFCYDNSDTCDAASDAIDAGDPAACAATDQRDEARPFDGDGDGVAVCDIGSYEQQQGPRPCQVGCSNVVEETPTPAPTSAAVPTAMPVQPLAVPQTGGRPGTDGGSPLAAVAALPLLAGAAALSWRMLRRR
jgi:hypothetical protein